MAPVNLNRKLILETPVRVPDGAGGYIETWVQQGNLWAQIFARGGRETTGEDTSLSRTGFRILVRSAPHGAPSRPTPNQRFREGNRIFLVVSVAEYDQAGRYLACLSEEEVVA